MIKKIGTYLLLVVALLQLLCSCHWNELESPRSPKDTNTIFDLNEQPKERVMIFISAGFNNLSTYLKEDIQDMMQGYIPMKNGTDALFIIAKHTDGNLTHPTSPNLIRLYRNISGVTVADTLCTLEKGTILAKSETVSYFLNYIKENYPSPHYGLVISSHGNGWLPMGYYDDPSAFEGPIIKKKMRRIGGSGFFPFDEPDRPLTKTILQESYYDGGVKLSTEVEIEDLANAIPMHMDYILFDACLMGGVEVAYALKDVTDYVGFSQAEVMAFGFNYFTMASHLLERDNPSPMDVCLDFLDQYLQKPRSESFATVSLVKTASLDDLASACEGIFDTYRESIATVNWYDVQCFGGSKHWYFDLRDILVKSGVDEESLSAVDSALEECVVFKGHTGQYYSITNGINEIDSFCGLSMYLPKAGSAYLDDKYQDLDWNKSTNYINL